MGGPCSPTPKPQDLVAQCLDFIALEGRHGVALRDVFAACESDGDLFVRRHVWRMLQRQAATGVLVYCYRAPSTTGAAAAAAAASPVSPPPNNTSTSKKRKRTATAGW